MPKNKNVDGYLKKVKPFILGTLRGLAVFCVLYFLLGFIMYKTNADLTVLYYAVYLFIAMGGFVCGIYVYRKIGGRGFLTGVTSTIPYSIIVFLIFLFVNGFHISDNILLVFVLTLSGGFLGGITAANTKI